jgi:hypothetical protein
MGKLWTKYARPCPQNVCPTPAASRFGVACKLVVGGGASVDYNLGCGCKRPQIIKSRWPGRNIKNTTQTETDFLKRQGWGEHSFFQANHYAGATHQQHPQTGRFPVNLILPTRSRGHTTRGHQSSPFVFKQTAHLEFELNYQNAIRDMKTYACCQNNPGADEMKTLARIVAWMCSGAQHTDELLCKAADKFSLRAQCAYAWCGAVVGAG